MVMSEFAEVRSGARARRPELVLGVLDLAGNLGALGD